MTPSSNTPKRNLALALALALLALLVRSRHLDWGLPDLEEEAFPLKKAFEMCGWGTGDRRWDPDTAGWPSLSFYVHMAVQHLHYGFGRLTGAFADRGDYFLQQTTWTPLAVWARAVGVLAAAVVVYVGARLGGRLAGWGGALITGVILLASPLLTRHAQLITPDILVAMFAALALASTVAVQRRGRLRDYIWAGVWIGLGVSAKYTPVLLLPVLWLAHLMRRREEGVALRRLGLDDRRLWCAAGACLVAFAGTSPFVLTDLNVLIRDVDYQVAHLQGGHFGHAAQAAGPVFYARDVLGSGLGWPAFLLGLSGMVAAAWRRRGSWSVVLAAFVVFYGVLSLLSTRFDRYMLPALLPLALGTAGWWALLQPRLRARHSSLVAIGAVAVALVAGIGPGLASARFLARQGEPSTLQQAKEWILQQRRPDGGPYLAMELYTPALPRAKQVWLRRSDPAFAKLTPAQQRRWLDIDPVKVVYLPFYTTRRGAGDFYYDLRHYLDYDYVVTSSAVRGRYEQDRARYRRQNAFYAELEAKVPDLKVFTPGENGRGPEIRFYAITPETRTRLSRSLTPISQDEFRAAAGQVVGSHFRDFVRSVAEHARERGDAKTAATYYQPLYETTPPDRRDEILPAFADAVLRSGAWAQAEPLLQRWQRLDPKNPVPTGYLGVAHHQMGLPDQAAAEYAASLELAAGSDEHAEFAAWIRQQQAELEREP